jgi:hypothetical protein
MKSPMKVATIADKLDFQVCSAFLSISFYSSVRSILGYDDPVVLVFLKSLYDSRNVFA